MSVEILVNCSQFSVAEEDLGHGQDLQANSADAVKRGDQVNCGLAHLCPLYEKGGCTGRGTISYSSRVDSYVRKNAVKARINPILK